MIETPDESIRQDPGIPGADTTADPTQAPLPDEKDPAAEEREAPETDREGHMSEGRAP